MPVVKSNVISSPPGRPSYPLVTSVRPGTLLLCSKGAKVLLAFQQSCDGAVKAVFRVACNAEPLQDALEVQNAPCEDLAVGALDTCRWSKCSG